MFNVTVGVDYPVNCTSAAPTNQKHEKARKLVGGHVEKKWKTKVLVSFAYYHNTPEKFEKEQ